VLAEGGNPEEEAKKEEAKKEEEKSDEKKADGFDSTWSMDW